VNVTPTSLPGAVVLEPRAFPDERGFFVETYRREWHEAAGIPAAEHFVQDNHSRSTRGVLRGMHFQIGAGIAKLVRCGRGRIVDVIVDLRRGSPTYAQWDAVTLDDERLCELYVPVGFAHGFCVLSDVADVLYKQTGYYDGAVERGIAWNDPQIAVDWPTDVQPLVSARDAAAPTLSEIAHELPFVYDG
jgi:dTDP-4-dehydrorhamnose 3,5-epimerase